MKKIINFTILLLLGLVLSQLLPTVFSPDIYAPIRAVSDVVMLVALSYIMINVGVEFEIEKTKLKSYGLDYMVAMGTAALPWILVTLYFMSLLPTEFWSSTKAWTETLLIGRFAAPTSAGILFAMLAAAGLGATWVFQKARVLAIFDDLDTILLMIPLQVVIAYQKTGQISYEFIITLVVIVGLLMAAWKGMNRLKLPHTWMSYLLYSIGIVLFCKLIAWGAQAIIPSADLHIEVLMPAFVLGVMMKCAHHEHSPAKDKADTWVSTIFMFLVGLSTPIFLGITAGEAVHVDSVTASQPMMSWGAIALHVLAITVLSNVGKMVPMFFYRDRKPMERLALSIGMFARGEVGAGILMIAIGYNYGGPILIIAVLALVLNLVLTGGFIYLVKKILVKTCV